VRTVPGSARNWIAVNAVNNPTSTKEKKKYMTTPSVKNSIDHSPWRRGLLLIPLLLSCFVLLPKAQAVFPPPDGGYGNNTAEGTQALLSLMGGTFNTAVGFHALHSDTNGSNNTGIGAQALFSDTFGSHNTASGDHALFLNNGDYNTANGYQALFHNRPLQHGDRCSSACF